MTEEIPGVLSIEGRSLQSIPLVLDSPHSGVSYPADFAHQADPSLLRQAEDTHVHTLWRGAMASGAVSVATTVTHSVIPYMSAVDSTTSQSGMDDGSLVTPTAATCTR